MARALLLLALILVPTAASASPGIYSANLTVFLGGGSNPGNPGGGPGNLVSYSGGIFSSAASGLPAPTLTVPAGAFQLDRGTPYATVVGGTMPVPTAPNSIFLLGQIVNQSTGSGSFGSGLGPGGGFGGALDVGMDLRLLIGVSPLASVFGTVLVPLGAGSAGTGTGMASVLANALTASAYGTGWTTGQVRYGTGVSGTPLATTGTVTGFQGVTSTSRNSHPTRTEIVTFEYVRLNLVTPILVHAVLNGDPQFQTFAGYASLQIRLRQIAPEPTVAVLLTSIAVIALGWRRGRC